MMKHSPLTMLLFTLLALLIVNGNTSLAAAKTASAEPTTAPIQVFLSILMNADSSADRAAKKTPRPTPASTPQITPQATVTPAGTPGAQGGPLKAFPGAVGYGTDTTGGRGGKVLYVANLNDSGPGSLREALTASGPRTVLFKVSGTITLSSDITVNQPYLTVAGQTAPGEGVQIRGAQIKISTHDVIVRYLKVRSGDANSQSSNADRDALALNDDTNAYNVVIDHSTLIWGPDVGGVTFLNGAKDSTISNSIVGEGLYISGHPEAVSAQGGHSMSMNVTELSSSNHPARITIHHNLLTTSSDRNPRVIGGELIDIVNNVVYNWRNSSSQGNPRSVNLINNFYIKGPMSTKSNALLAWNPRAEAGATLRAGSVYESGNLTEGFTTVRGGPESVYAAARFEPYSMPSEDSPSRRLQPDRQRRRREPPGVRRGRRIPGPARQRGPANHQQPGQPAGLVL